MAMTPGEDAYVRAGAENVQRLVTVALADHADGNTSCREIFALPDDPTELKSTINTAVGIITGLLLANCRMRSADPQATWAQFCTTRTAEREAQQ